MATPGCSPAHREEFLRTNEFNAGVNLNRPAALIGTAGAQGEIPLERYDHRDIDGVRSLLTCQQDIQLQID